MTNDKLKEAMLNRIPVIHKFPTTGEIEYERITALIYRLDDNNNVVVSAELRSKNGCSVTIAKAEDVKEK